MPTREEKPSLSPGVAGWSSSPLPGPRNTVVSARFADADADRRIREIGAAFAARGTGFLWWLAPFHAPRDLGERLLDAGLRFEGTAPAMAMDLEAGRALGYRIGVLQASDEGLPVYRRIGFRTVFDYAVYQA
jgi:hypothetical protein